MLGASSVPEPASFRDTWRGRAFTAFFLACTLMLAEPWLGPLTRPAIELFSAAAQAALGEDDVPVATVLIDEDEFAQRFNASSPLNRAELAQFFKLFDNDAPARLPAVIGIDLDLAPAHPNDIDSTERRALDTALDTLAARVPLVLVWPVLDAACRRDLQACRACRWVAQRKQHCIRFASPLLDDRGATFNRASASLGVAMAQAQRAAAPLVPPDAHPGVLAWLTQRGSEVLASLTKPLPEIHQQSPCALAAPAAGSAPHAQAAPGAHFPAEVLPRRGPLLHFRLGDVAQAEYRDQLGQALVVVGGAYDSRDTLTPSGWTQAVPSARVHAWVAASAARPYRLLIKAAILASEVALGVLFGAVFHGIWVRIGRAGVHFARLAIWCVAFALVAAALPLLILVWAIDLQELGFDATSLSVLVISMGVETIVSSQEMLIHQAQSHAGVLEQPSVVDRGVEVLWALLQWALIVGALVHHRPELPGLQAPTIAVIAVVCYLWPGGPLTWITGTAVWAHGCSTGRQVRAATGGVGRSVWRVAGTFRRRATALWRRLKP